MLSLIQRTSALGIGSWIFTVCIYIYMQIAKKIDVMFFIFEVSII